MFKSAIKVYARIKPNLDNNSKVHSFSIQQESIKENGKECLIINPSVECGKRARCNIFRFNRVFSPDTSQAEFYETVGRPVVNRLLSGYNGTIFAYGQTGTGKTHSIIGDLNCNESRGLILRVFHDIFTFIRKNSSFNYFISISSLEIYNEACYDLITLSDNSAISSSRVSIMEDSKGNIKTLNLKKYEINSIEDVMNYLQISLENRVVADTRFNHISSRSHFIFTVYLDQKSNNDGIRLNSKLHMIDLAGSERLSNRDSQIYLFKEAKSINLSLHYLEHVIVALTKPNRRHIPYRNSLLTSLLRDSLGGNFCTAMVVTISLETQNIKETITTCRFAQRVALIKNEPRISFKISKNESTLFKEKQSISEENIEQSKQAIMNIGEVSNSKTSYCESSSNTEYMNYTIEHINRGIKILSTLLNQVPHLIKNYLDNKEDINEKITKTLGLELPQVNRFTGERYDKEQKSAFIKFLSMDATNKALIKYLEMNFTYFKYLEIEWKLWNKERDIMEKLREAELKMRSVIKYGDFPEVIEKLINTHDKYVEKIRIIKQECLSVQEKKHKSLNLFMDARTNLFQVFEIWWRRCKQSEENNSSNNSSNENNIIENKNSSKSEIKISLKQTLNEHEEDKINYPFQSENNTKISSTISPNVYTKCQSPVSSKCVPLNSARSKENNSSNIDEQNLNIYKKHNYENKNLHLYEENNLFYNDSVTNGSYGVNPPILSKNGPMLFSVLNSKLSPFSSKYVTTYEENINGDYSNIAERNSDIQQLNNYENSLFLDYQNGTKWNHTIDSAVHSKNGPMFLSLFSTKTNQHSEHHTPKSTSQSPVLSTGSTTEISRRKLTSNKNEYITESASNFSQNCNRTISWPSTPSVHHGDKISTSSKTRCPMFLSLIREGDEPVKLKSTGNKDLDSRIISFYKNKQISVIL